MWPISSKMYLKEMILSSNETKMDMKNIHKAWKKEIKINQMPIEAIKLQEEEITALRKIGETWEIIEPIRRLTDNELLCIKNSNNAYKIGTTYENQIKKINEIIEPINKLNLAIETVIIKTKRIRDNNEILTQINKLEETIKNHCIGKKLEILKQDKRICQEMVDLLLPISCCTDYDKHRNHI